MKPTSLFIRGFSAIVLTLAIATALALYCGAGAGVARAAEGPVDHEVIIRGMTFTPAVVHLHRGDTVTWKNMDIVPHAAQSADPKQPWRSKDLQPGDSWTWSAPVESDYICPFHPTMKGRITVE